MLTCALIVLPLYYGFWQLGRNVSLSPVEIAHTFGAPILASTTVKGGIKHFERCIWGCWAPVWLFRERL